MKKFWIAILLLAIIGVWAVLLCNGSISRYSKDRLYDSVDEIPHRHATVVLGTSPIGRSGGPNLYFINRIEACTDLYNAGKTDRIIVSGDNSVKEYNEPEAMRQALIEKGIPAEVIFLDYAGFRTLDSVVRAKEVFGQSQFIIISQKFHNERAVFLAGKKGIDAIGYNAAGVDAYYGFLTSVREKFARCKVFIDLIIGKDPHFLGAPVNIG